MANGITGKAFDFALFRRVMTYVRPYKGLFYITAFLTIFLSVIALIRPVLIQITIDDYIVLKDAKGLMRMIILLTVVLIVESIFQYFF